MALKNYTTEIDVYKTIGEIQGLLVRQKARSITVEHEQPSGVPAALHFEIDTRFGLQSYRLPVRIQAVLNTLHRQRDSGALRGVRVNPQTGARVAWRIAKDWLAAQLALIETDMATLEEVMLPYALVGDGLVTVYDRLAERGIGETLAPQRAVMLLPPARDQA